VCFARPQPGTLQRREGDIRLPILRIVNRGVDRETYGAMRAMLDIDHKHPLGLIMHGVSEVNGTMQVAQVWESEEYARRFDEDLLKPVIETLDAPRDAEITVFNLEHLVTP
jgi:hypothetical protein